MDDQRRSAMKQGCVKGVAAICVGLLMSAGASADATGGFDAYGGTNSLADHFGELPSGLVEVMDPVQMQETQGELWPLIGAVVTVDLALATFFWGTYVPTVTGGASASNGRLMSLPF
jgi:hypothetical protein